MPDLFDLFQKWWKWILSLVVIAVVITTIIVFLIPKSYLGVTTALPTPDYTADKSSVFSQNLQNLYSAFGTPDDLDKILGTAHLDTVYKAVAEKLDLVNHYHIENSSVALQKAALYLKEKTRVIKTDYGELQVKVWDGDKLMAAEMANGIMEKLQQIHQDIQTASNATILAKINDEYTAKKTEYQRLLDSLSHTNAPELLSIQKATLLEQIGEYEKLSNQYTLMVNSKPQVLAIVEKATPRLYPDKPNRPEIIIAVAVLSFIFGLFGALIMERRKMVK
jgi:capsular polysaccharide biosynthesis protein